MATAVKSKRNWSAYNAALVNRGYLTIFVSKDFATEWYVNYDENTTRKRGGQAKYTEQAITALLSLRFVFKQPLRSMEGFAKSLVTMMNLDLEVPDYSTLSRKINEMNIRLPRATKSNSGHIISLDSTGLKIHGQGEWNRKKHSQRDRRQWVKMHLAVDNDSMKILAVESTADDVHDCEVFETLIDNVPEQINTVMADGAYGTIGAYKKSEERNIKLVARPKNSDVVNPKATDPYNLKRNQQVGYYHEKGIYAWAKKNDYWQRNRAETTMSRYTTTFTDKLASRNVQSQKNEITLKCHILNIFMSVNNEPQDSAA
jgi:hypothetical protein